MPLPVAAQVGLQLAPMVLPMLFGGREQEPPQNAALEQLLRQQGVLMQQADPLYQAILRMAAGLMPRSATQGLDIGAPRMPGQAYPRPGGSLPRGQRAPGVAVPRNF